eukprot:6208311-Pleurochrysis_carterae.AAC.2
MAELPRRLVELPSHGRQRQPDVALCHRALGVRSFALLIQGQIQTTQLELKSRRFLDFIGRCIRVRSMLKERETIRSRRTKQRW